MKKEKIDVEKINERMSKQKPDKYNTGGLRVTSGDKALSKTDRLENEIKELKERITKLERSVEVLRSI